jgi:phosphatidylinositol-3-phosphatase
MMASLSSSDSPGGEDLVSSGDSPESDDLGNNLPMPAPWVAAIAVLALLAFGVFVGSAASPAAPSGAATPTLLVLASTARKPVVPTGTVATPPPPTAATPTPLPSGEAVEPAATSTVKAAPAPKTKASAPKAGKNTTGKPGAPGPSATAALPPIKHVFLIVLSDQGAAAAFGPSSPAPYLAKTLSGEGELLENYYAVSQGELANAIALISGQGPTPQTVGDCPQYTDIAPGAAGPEGQVLGSGCVYPAQTLTLANQLTAAGKTWKAYVEGLEAEGPGQPASCRHPALGSADPENAASPGDPYVTWRNPFVYFHSLIDGSECARNDVGLDRLSSDLKAASSTPSLAYVAPDGCDDGSEAPCTAGAPGGLEAAEGFLRKVVPEIKASAAYREGGLIAITSDQAPQTGPGADSSGCCTTSAYPNLGAPQTSAPGGGRVGLLLISKYVKPGTLNVTGEYNHFSLLRSIENLFGLKPLGYAAAPGLLAFDSSVFNAHR